MSRSKGRVRATPGVPDRRLWLLAVLATAVLVPLCAGSVWYLTGGRVEIVASPSMGTAAPVGTLVLTRPTDDIRVGDVVTFRPPNPLVQHTTTHRVVAVDARAAGGPTYTTRGDLNGADDPGVIRRGDVVGKAVVLGWGLGWLVRGAPFLVVGAILIWWATGRWVTPFWRVPLRVLGPSLLVAGVTAWLRPFVGVLTLGTTADTAGSHIGLVSTGMLPIRIIADTGGHLDLVDGQAGVLTTVLPDGARGTVLTSGPHMAWWVWVLLTLLWLLPMACGLVAALRNPWPDEPGAGPPDRRPPRNPPPRDPTPREPVTEPIPWVRAGADTGLDILGRLRTIGLGTGLLALTVGLTLTTSTTTARFTAAVTNSTNTAASSPYFTCRAAFPDVAGANDYLVWPLADAVVLTGSTAEDISGNGRTGIYVNGFTSTTNTPCPRDTPARAVTLAPTALAPSYVTMTTVTAISTRNVFSEAIWFRTTTTTGGKLIGFGNTRVGTSGVYDRHVYMTDGGNIVFGVYPGGVRTVTSPRTYNDGQWHLAVATLSSAGMVLYLDGAAVATDTTTTTAEGGTGNTGFWRAGYDNLNGWTSRPTTDYFTGSLAYATIYNSALTDTQVRLLYVAGT